MSKDSITIRIAGTNFSGSMYDHIKSQTAQEFIRTFGDIDYAASIYGFALATRNHNGYLTVRGLVRYFNKTKAIRKCLVIKKENDIELEFVSAKDVFKAYPNKHLVIVRV